MTTTPPPFPEAALRAVLVGTVAAWAGARPHSPSAEDEPRRLYLDAFAGAEFQFGTGVARSGDDETRASAAFRALDGAGSEPPPTAVFIEEDPAHLGRIYAELEDSAGGEWLRATRDLPSLAPGEISLLEAPFTTVAAVVARPAAGARTFALLAPPAARSLPWDALRPLASLPEATLLIRLPHSDFDKQSRHNSPLADLPAFARRIVEGCSALLDDSKHAWLPAWRAEAAAKGDAAAFASVLERFRELLDTVAAGRILKPMELEAADGARTWLFLLTPDPGVALAANAAVRAAKMKDRAAAANPITVAAPPVATPAAAPPAPPERSPSPAVVSEAPTEEAAAVAPAPKKGRRAAKASSRAGTPSPADAAAAAPEADPPAAEPAPTDDATPAVREGGLPDVPAAGFNPPGKPATSSTEDVTASVTPVVPSEPSDAAPAPRARPPVQPRPEPQPVAEFLDLFPEQIATPEYVLPTRPDPADLAAALESRFAGTTVAWRDLLRAYAATDATPAELKAALAVLRRGGRAAYKALKKDDDAIEFLAEPVVREKPKRARKAKGDDGGLFGEAAEGADSGGTGE